MDKKLDPKNEPRATPKIGDQRWGSKNGARYWAQNWTQQSSPVDLKTAPKTDSRIWVSQQTPICVFHSQCQKNRAAERKMFASRPNPLNRSRWPNTPQGQLERTHAKQSWLWKLSYRHLWANRKMLCDVRYQNIFTYTNAYIYIYASTYRYMCWTSAGQCR